MTNFKGYSGFTLVEVMAALLIFGIVMGSLFVSETLVLRTVSLFSAKLHRIFSAKKFLYKIHKESEKKEEKSAPKEEFVKEAGVTTHFIFKQDPSKINALKNFKDMMVQTVKIEWSEHGRHRSDQLVTFAFKPKKQKQKKE